MKTRRENGRNKNYTNVKKKSHICKKKKNIKREEEQKGQTWTEKLKTCENKKKEKGKGSEREKENEKERERERGRERERERIHEAWSWMENATHSILVFLMLLRLNS